MAEQGNSGENTQTRKTVKLKLPNTPGGNTVRLGNAAAPIVDPLGSRDTDTGNLDVLSDTQTRKTVKLKPLTPQVEKHSINLDSVSTATVTGGVTQSRKILKLKPNPHMPSPVVPAPAAEASPITKPPAETPVNDETVQVNKVAAPPVRPVLNPRDMMPKPKTAPDSDDTVQVDKVGAPALRPKLNITSAAAGDDNTIAVKVVTQTPPVVPDTVEETDTVAVDKVPAHPKAATIKLTPSDADETDEDHTVKLKRPPRMDNAAPPPVAAQPVVPVASTAVVDSTKATIKLERPAVPVAPTAVSDSEKATIKLERPAAPVESVESAPAAAEVAADDLLDDGAEESEEAVDISDEEAPVTLDLSKHLQAEAKPSLLYTILAMVSLLLLTGAAGLGAWQYYQVFWEK